MSETSSNQWENELTEADISSMIDELAKKVSDRRMETAAILFLEMHKPLAFLAGQSLIAGSPFLVPIFGAERINRYSIVLGSRENVERLIYRIEQTADERESALKKERCLGGKEK